MKKFLVQLLVLASFFGISYVNAASFVPVQEMTYCNSDAYIKSNSGDEYSDRQDSWNPNDNYVHSYNELNFPDGNAFSESSSSLIIQIETTGESGYADDLIHMSFHSSSAAEINSEEVEQTYVWSGAEMVTPGTATGNFYQIVAEAGESDGDWVTITVDFYAAAFGSSGGGSSFTTLIHGPNDGEILFTRNCEDFTDPQSDEIIHTYAVIDSDCEYSDQATFSAQIGDIIGIHCGTYTNAYTGEYMGYANATADLSINLILSEGTPEFTAKMADFDGSGVVDLADFALFASVWLQSTETN